jgi:basic amino acid/polyamine antiporter, APA family
VPENPASLTIPGGYTVPAVALLVILWFLAHLNGQKAFGMGVPIAVLSVVFFGNADASVKGWP